MKNKYKFLVLIAVSLFFSLSSFAQDLSPLSDRINRTSEQIKTIVQAVIGLVALGGGIAAYMKVNADDGGSGKKAIGNFVLALIFGSLIIVLIEVFI